MPTLTDNDLKEIKDLFSIQSGQINELKASLSKINETVTEIKINQARTEERLSGQIQNLDTKLSGQIQTLDEKLSGQNKALDKEVTGLSKRLENQEFTNRGILIALVVALIAGAAKLFGFLPTA
jgi:septation ring formation regulator EzrA